MEECKNVKLSPNQAEVLIRFFEKKVVQDGSLLKDKTVLEIGSGVRLL